jgi:hypothetical protein
MALKVKFILRAEPSLTDQRTTVTHLIAMQFMDDDLVFGFPDECKALTHHERLFSLPIAIAAKKDLTPRWRQRSFKVTLPPDIAALYADDDGNAVFATKLLDEFIDDHLTAVSRSSLTSSSANTRSEPPDQLRERSLSSIVKDAVITKFSGKSNLSNANAWIDSFEAECTRLQIDRSRFWEVLRLFLEESAEKWYATTRLTSSSTGWEFWRESFIENFGQRGLAFARTVFTYHYISGSLSDYVQQKLHLLASFNPKMHDLDKMTHLALGLPNTLQERINVTEVNTLGKMISVINTFDRANATRSISSSPNVYSSSSPFATTAFSSLRAKTPCSYCKKKGFERFHPLKDCLTKFRDDQRKFNNSYCGRQENNVNKAVNSLELNDLQREINEIQKNE